MEKKEKLTKNKKINKVEESSPEYNKKSKLMQEVDDIISGKIKGKGYHNLYELMEDLEK